MWSGDRKAKDTTVKPVLNGDLSRPSVLREKIREIENPVGNTTEDVASSALRGLITVDSTKKYIYLKSLPTSNPNLKDVVWNSSGTLMVSSGT